MKFFPPFSLELTLAIIKPHASRVPPIVNDIKEIIHKNGFYVIQQSCCVMGVEHAQEMYAEHKGKTFFDRLVEMMTSGPVNTFVLAREDAIKTWRQLMGPTRTFDAQYTQPMSLRGTYGLSNTRNATHGSDSPPSVFKEVAVFFPSFDICKWYEEEEPYFRNGFVRFCEESGTHVKEDKDAPVGLFEKKSP